MTLNDIADEVFVINLERRQDRAEHMREQSEKHQFDALVVRAVDAKEIQNPTSLRDGEHALLLSHAGVIQWAKQKGWEKIVILEDDCYFHNDFNSRLQSEFAEIPDDWEVVMLSGNHFSLGAGSIPPESVSENVIRVRSSFTTHALVIKSSVFDLILDQIYKFEHPLDVIYCRSIQSRGKTYSFKNSMGGQIDCYSDIIQYNPGYNSRGVYD